MAKVSKRFHIGTSGWSYPHWKGSFYPEHLSSEKWLAYYAEHFRSAEINNSFYHLPEKKTLQKWCEMTPEAFRFAVKASRYITHMKKLKDAEKSVPELLKRIDVLGERLGPVLFQLPPRWHVNLERLEHFLDALSADFQYAMEFRDPTWYSEGVYDLLSRHKVAFCIYELDHHVSPEKITADFVYIRLHGPGGPYQGSYTDKAIRAWASSIRSWSGSRKHAYCYFDNDEAGYAASNALSLQKALQAT